MPYNYQPYQQNQVFMQQPQQGYPTAMPRQDYSNPPMQYQGYQANQNPQQNQNPCLIKVLSEAEAQSYPVAFGASVAMLDTQLPKMYIKSVDMNGVPAFMKYKLIEDHDEPAAPAQNLNDMYVTREEYKTLCEEHSRVMDAIAKIAERMGANEHEQSGS